MFALLSVSTPVFALVKDIGPLISPEKELAAASLTVKGRGGGAVGHGARTDPAVGETGDCLGETVQVEVTRAVDRQHRRRGEGIGDAVLERSGTDQGPATVGIDTAEEQDPLSALVSLPVPAAMPL